MITNELVGGACISFARRSIGNTAMMDGKGNSKPPELTADAGGGEQESGCGRDWVAATGDELRGVALATKGFTGATALAPVSSKRRSSPRSNPANFDFTMFGMVNTYVCLN